MLALGGKKKKKGYSVASLWNFALAIVILGVVVLVGAIILTNFQAATTANTYAYNLTGKALKGLNEFGNWFKILVIAGIAGVVLVLIIMYLVPRMGSSRQA